MVKRHTLLAHPTFPNLPAEVVSASDYDALAAERDALSALSELHIRERDNAMAEIERLRKLIDGAAETGEIYERRLSECEAENDRLRTLLREALEWPVPVSWASDVRAALGTQADQPEGPQAPIAKIGVLDGKVAVATLYAPGLPDGEYDLYCVPEAVAPMMPADQPTPVRFSLDEEYAEPDATHQPQKEINAGDAK